MWEELEDILSALPRGLDPLTLNSRLRNRCHASDAAVAAEIYLLRERSVGRFLPGYLPYLHRKGFEQATPQVVAEERAQRIRRCHPPELLWDATCGLGSDAVAAKRAGLNVVASDSDHATARFARANLDASQAGGVGRAWVLRASAAPHVVRADGLLIDPDRRPDGRRTLDPRRWSPTLEASLDLASLHRAACIKLAPAFEPPAPEALPLSVEWEWVSSRGELVELRAWLGAWRRADRPEEERSVVKHGSGGSVERWQAVPAACPALAREAAEGIGVLAEADPSVLRAGLLGTLARELGLAPLAPQCAYLGSTEPPSLPGQLQPFVRTWSVLASCPLDRKRVRRMLGEHDVGPLTVKKRGHPESAEMLAKRFAGKGSRTGLLAVARLERGYRAYLLDAPGRPPDAKRGDRDGR